MSLEKLRSYKATKNTGSLQKLKVVGIHLDCDVVPYFPKLKGADGKVQKSPEGKDLRSEVQEGWLYTMSEYGTAKQLKFVLPNFLEFEPLTAYEVEGSGYDIKTGNMYFLVQEVDITEVI